MSTKKFSGICALTSVSGQYVNSHIIPRALTRLSNTGERVVEGGIGWRRKMSYESWFDNKLVIRSGEDILARIDSAAIRILRDNRLIWSSWGSETKLREDEIDWFHNELGIRELEIENTELLQLFFLSLTWRAAASRRPEFAEIKLSDVDLNNLRLRVLNEDAGRIEDYPIQLFQLATRGIAHNRSPLLETTALPNDDGTTGPTISYVRFYFDGLVAYVHLLRGAPLPPGFTATMLGGGNNGKTLISSLPFEHSRAFHNIIEMMRAVEGGNSTERSSSSF